MPSGLGDKYEALLTAADVARVTDGCLRDAEIFSRVARWPSFGQAVRPGTVVSGRVAETLDELSGGGLFRLDRTVTLRDALALELDDLNATPEVADRLGAVVTRELLATVEARDITEHDQLREYVTGVRFRTCDPRGSWALASELVLPGGLGSEEEALRAAVAPMERVLAPHYSEQAAEFFKACRRQLSAGVEDLERWAVAAVAADQRVAMYRYLLRGSLRQELADRLRAYRDGWFRDLTTLDTLVNDPGERMQLRGILRLFEEPLPDLPVEITPPPDPAKLLSRVHEWWMANREQYLAQYEAEVYPGGERPNLNAGSGWNDLERRREWMKLFLIAIGYTMGRTQPAQHRTFLERCDREGWLDVFAAPERDPDLWIGVLDQYLDPTTGDIQYFHWMRQFVSIYQMSRYLGVYGECFLQMNRAKEPFALDLFLKPRQGEMYFSGSDLSAPPATRALGSGANFVLRELVRLGHVRSVHAYQHCYVAPPRVRGVLLQLGCVELAREDAESRHCSIAIDRFLQRHMKEDQTHFGLCFDLPFLAMAEDSSILKNVMDVA